MSTLVLSMIDAPQGTRYEARHVDGKRFTIGRDAENDWVLHDPQRRLSRCHCVFERGDTGWAVVDMSRNGIVHARERHGQAVDTLDAVPSGLLCTGDVLRLGDYALSVTVQDDDSSFQFRPLPAFLDRLRQSLPEKKLAEPVQDVDATMIMPASAASAALKSGSGASKAKERERAAVSGDPLLELMGLDEHALTPERRAVALYRIASALDAVMRGMRQLSEIAHEGDEATAYAFGTNWSRKEMLRWIAGLSTTSPITPDLAIETMFARLRHHQVAAQAANRETARVLLDILNPDGVEDSVPGRRRVLSTAGLRRRHRRLRERLDEVVDMIHRRAYSAFRGQGIPAGDEKQEGGDARGSAL